MICELKERTKLLPSVRGLLNTVVFMAGTKDFNLSDLDFLAMKIVLTDNNGKEQHYVIDLENDEVYSDIDNYIVKRIIQYKLVEVD